MSTFYSSHQKNFQFATSIASQGFEMILVIYPHQLFRQHPGLALQPDKVILVEDPLFFRDRVHQPCFHKQKLWLHRASMKRYSHWLAAEGHEVAYLDYSSRADPLAEFLTNRSSGSRGDGEHLIVSDPVDYLLTKRLHRLKKLGATLEILPTPGFINTQEENTGFRHGKKRWFMADFYKWQRQRLGILMDGDQPQGGKWSFDEDNRKKVPADQLRSLPSLPNVDRDAIDREAIDYVNENFPDSPGSLDRLFYPTSHAEAKRWLADFLEKRFKKFGDFEDAIVDGQSWLWHSVLTPTLNIGLLTPREVVDATLQFADKQHVPLNSLEGFLRQIIGWREFMRATYEDLGVGMRTTNRWSHFRKIPNSFYNASTGIAPIDDTISRIIETGYCHHIERLMILGGFMFLCEFDPNEIYCWFMEMFVDSYDWVMVPNVYAMSQNADGGKITTKPYFSGSAYVRKMSNHKKGDWCDTWDGLYWRWIFNHSDSLRKNPRWAMMCSMAAKMAPEKRDRHLDNANRYLGSL